MITQLWLALALDGTSATTGSASKHGITPCGEVMLVAVLFSSLFLTSSYMQLKKFVRHLHVFPIYFHQILTTAK